MTASTGAPAPEQREKWSGQTAFILAAVGSAVGLGNIWRFPGQAYESGGGAFMIPYLIALVTAGIPLLLLENGIGHRFRGSAPLALRRVHKRAEGVGWFQIAVSFVIGLYYTVVIAWAVSFFFFSFNLDYAEDPAGFFIGEYLQLGDEVKLGFDIVPGVMWPLLAIWAIAIIVLALGVHNGVERLNVVGIPLLVVTFIVLAVRAMMLDGAMDGIEALFTPDFSALADINVWIAAYGQVFFSLSLAYGVMITYASYRKKRSNMTAPAFVVAFGNCSFSLLAGFAVFGAIGFLAHEQGVSVAELDGLTGVSLSFITFPAVIAQMPGGPIFGAAFFASLVIAGLTSLISLLQTISAALQDKFGWHPRGSAVAVGLIMATLSVLGFSTTTGLYLLDTVDQWSNQLGIVAGAIGMVAAVMIARRGREIALHLSAVSTLGVGRAWRVLVVGVSLLLTYMLVRKTVELATQGYEGYPGEYLAVFGWGTAGFLVLIAIVLPLMPWHRAIAEFDAWPTEGQLEEAAAGAARKGGA
ncbi:sodium-dependent transporter [Demequina pelophila]|uniref:sodium-dependent transporter n=1 Tax=Demequina pelophila TaxID=1638984 RepID=UPI0007834086|nr:sodium-dependent transporter [Demequina pelophila]